MRLLFLFSFLVSSSANAGSVFCSQEVNLKVLFFPVPIIKTIKMFGPAYGEGSTEGEARVALAKNLISIQALCKKDGAYSDVRAWCSDSSVECVGDVN